MSEAQLDDEDHDTVNKVMAQPVLATYNLYNTGNLWRSKRFSISISIPTFAVAFMIENNQSVLYFNRRKENAKRVRSKLVERVDREK